MIPDKEISVIIPNYNHAPYLKQRIDSVLNQSFTDFELIILDDFSSDGSREIISLYKEKFPWIQVVFCEKHSGSPYIQWNKGIRLSSGKYIWIAESDDIAETSFLYETYSLLSQNSDFGFVHTESKKIDENGTIICNRFHGNSNDGRWLNNILNSGKEEIASYLYLSNTVNNASSVLFRKDKMLKAGLADEKMKFAGDWLLYTKILFHADYAYISQPLNSIRFHVNSTHWKYFKDFSYIKEVFRVYRFCGDNISFSLLQRLKMIRVLLSIIKGMALSKLGSCF
ncbi:MAG: glycosyltransferase [Candidatus Riflebacteria bacterium]|nr:glycosyltransferase [Candidatus Riflebacteria bacterium]